MRAILFNAVQALEEEQRRVVPAPFEFVADLPDLLPLAVRVGDEQRSLTGFDAGFELLASQIHFLTQPKN